MTGSLAPPPTNTASGRGSPCAGVVTRSVPAWTTCSCGTPRAAALRRIRSAALGVALDRDGARPLRRSGPLDADRPRTGAEVPEQLAGHRPQGGQRRRADLRLGHLAVVLEGRGGQPRRGAVCRVLLGEPHRDDVERRHGGGLGRPCRSPTVEPLGRGATVGGLCGAAQGPEDRHLGLRPPRVDQLSGYLAGRLRSGAEDDEPGAWRQVATDCRRRGADQGDDGRLLGRPAHPSASQRHGADGRVDADDLGAEDLDERRADARQERVARGEDDDLVSPHLPTEERRQSGAQRGGPGQTPLTGAAVVVLQTWCCGS